MPFTLTDEQDTIIHAAAGHYVISAVAGSGKTTTLAYRIRYLLEQGISSKRMLILMFNRAAREDFQAKLASVLFQPSPSQENNSTTIMPEVRTFHAMAYRLYKRFIQEGYLPAFKPQILSEKEQDFQLWRLLNQLLEGEQLQNLKRHKKDHIQISRDFIETVKSGLDAPEIVFEGLDIEPKFNYLLELFHRFEQWRKQEARISYSDMLYDTVMAIRANPELRQLVKNKMDVVLVDEYQDTNDIQHALLKYIAGDRAKITVVGDPDQTIYEFRGAKPEYIIKGFSEEFSDASLLSLSYSFRYGHAVSLLANHLISKNTNRLPVLCKSHQTNPNTDIHLNSCRDDSLAVAQLLDKMEPMAWKETAVLVRVWSQTVAIELALLEADIPYHIDGHLGVFHSSEIKAIRALLELSAGEFRQFSAPKRLEKFEQICQFPHIGLPEYQLKQLCAVLAQSDNLYGETLLGLIPAELKKFQQLKLERLAKVLAKIENNQAVCAELFKLYAEETELYEGIRSLSFNHEQAEERVRSIMSIFAFISKPDKQKNHGKTAADALKRLDALAHQAEQVQPNSVKICSIHRAKGLEWQHVLIPGLNNKTFPHSLTPEKISMAELESERRLLYVAMTRAKRHLHLFTPKDQTSKTNKVSRFEKELNFDQCHALSRHLYAENTAPLQLKNNLYPSPILQKYANALSCALHMPEQTKQPPISQKAGSDFSQIVWKGLQVEHCLLGEGRVIEEKKSAFTVEFEGKEQRTFSKEFAGRFFQIVDQQAF